MASGALGNFSSSNTKQCNGTDLGRTAAGVPQPAVMSGTDKDKQTSPWLLQQRAHLQGPALRAASCLAPHYSHAAPACITCSAANQAPALFGAAVAIKMRLMLSANSVQRGRGEEQRAAGAAGGARGRVRTKVAKEGAHLSHACITYEEGGGEEVRVEEGCGGGQQQQVPT